MFKERGLADYLRVNIEALGSEWIYGPRSRDVDSREVVLRLSATHKQAEALKILAREITPAALAMAPGITGGVRPNAKDRHTALRLQDAGRPRPSRQILYHSCLVSKEALKIQMHLDGAVHLNLRPLMPGLILGHDVE